jgi:hypothetical protein
MTEAADVDGGLLHSRRDAPVLAYRTQQALYQQDQVTLSYADGYLTGELAPTDDDQVLRNDVTISHPGGGFGRATKETGERSIEQVGRYGTSYGLNAATDEQVTTLAQYAVHLGTWPELRYPLVEAALARRLFVADPELTADVAALDIGRPLTLTGLPEWLPPDDAHLLVRGYTETLANRGWSFRWNMQAYGPWLATNKLNATTGEYNLASASVSVLEGALTDSATSFQVNSPGPVALWRTGTSLARAVKAGGETMAVGTIADSVTDSFTRTVASGWGSTDTGQAWTNAGGTAANFNVAAGVGTISLASINASRRLTMATTYGDSTAVARFTISASPTGDDVETTLMGRYQDGSNYMQASIFWDGDATFADLQIVRRLAGAATTLAVRTAPFTQASSSLTAWLMFQCHGSRYRMKAWIGARSNEPSVWLLGGTDTSFSSGLNGIRGNIQPSFSGSTPVTVTVEDYAVTNPQTFSSVTRSVNGVVKAHDAATVMVASLPVAVGDEVTADLLNEISGINDSASFLRITTVSPLVSSANTDASILTGSFDFISGYAYEITMAARFAIAGTYTTDGVVPRCIFGLRRTNASGTQIFNSGYIPVTDNANFHFDGSQVVKVTAGDTTQTISFIAQYSSVAGASSMSINLNGTVTPARMTIKRIGLAANHADAIELPTA